MTSKVTHYEDIETGLNQYLEDVDHIAEVDLSKDPEVGICLRVRGYKKISEEPSAVEGIHFQATTLKSGEEEYMLNLAKMVEKHRKWRNFKSLVVKA